MNKSLLNAIHRYAEDREIDYIAAKYIVESYTGHKITTQDEMVKWKQEIDMYLKTFDEKKFIEFQDELDKIKESN